MRRWHLEHADGSEWTRGELDDVIRIERKHDHTWPYDATLFDVTVDADSRVYLLDNCSLWRMADYRADDMVVVWDD